MADEPKPPIFIDLEGSALMVGQRVAAVLGIDLDRGEPLDITERTGTIHSFSSLTIETDGLPANPNRAQRRAAARRKS